MLHSLLNWRSDTILVGFLAQIIRLIEDHPFKSQLTRRNPTLTFLRQAALSSRDMPEDLRQAILGAQSSKRLLEYMDSDRERRAMVRTSTAVDMIQGGDKGKLRRRATGASTVPRLTSPSSELIARECQRHSQPPHRNS